MGDRDLVTPRGWRKLVEETFSLNGRTVGIFAFEVFLKKPSWMPAGSVSSLPLSVHSSAALMLEQWHAFQYCFKWDDKPHLTVVPWGEDERGKKQLSAVLCFVYFLVRKACHAFARELPVVLVNSSFSDQNMWSEFGTVLRRRLEALYVEFIALHALEKVLELKVSWYSVKRATEMTINSSNMLTVFSTAAETC